MYAIIESCGRQYKVAEGDVVFFEKLETEVGKKITFDNVIMVSDNGKIKLGTPYVNGVKVEGKVVSHGKAKKIIVFKMKAKKNERKKQGHRQPYTKIEITSILTGSKKAEIKVETKAAVTAKAENTKVEEKTVATEVKTETAKTEPKKVEPKADAKATSTKTEAKK